MQGHSGKLLSRHVWADLVDYRGNWAKSNSAFFAKWGLHFDMTWFWSHCSPKGPKSPAASVTSAHSHTKRSCWHVQYVAGLLNNCEAQGIQLTAVLLHKLTHFIHRDLPLLVCMHHCSQWKQHHVALASIDTLQTSDWLSQTATPLRKALISFGGWNSLDFWKTPQKVFYLARLGWTILK